MAFFIHCYVKREDKKILLFFVILMHSVKFWVGRMRQRLGPFKPKFNGVFVVLDSFNSSCTMGVCIKRHAYIESSLLDNVSSVLAVFKTAAGLRVKLFILQPDS